MKPYFWLYNQSEENVSRWLMQGYKLVAVVPHGDSSTPSLNTSYHFVHKDYA